MLVVPLPASLRMQSLMAPKGRTKSAETGTATAAAFDTVSENSIAGGADAAGSPGTNLE